jgi:hypothetical protein
VEPSVEPTAAPTEAPATEAPATAPVESATAPASDRQVCRSDAAGIDVSYPAGWYTVSDGSQWTCLLFDPAPIEVLPDTELPVVAVQIFAEGRTYAEVKSDFETASVYKVVGTDTGVVDEHDATAYELENTGEGFYEKGVLQAVVVVDLGDRGTLIVETVGVAGAAYDANVEALIGIVETLQVD